MIINKDRLMNSIFDLEISLSELARRSGVTKASLSRWLNGKNVAEDSVRKLAQSLDVEPAWLVDPSPPSPKESKLRLSIQDRLGRLSAKLSKCDQQKIERDFLINNIMTALEARVGEL